MKKDKQVYLVKIKIKIKMINNKMKSKLYRINKHKRIKKIKLIFLIIVLKLMIFKIINKFNLNLINKVWVKMIRIKILIKIIKNK